MNSLEENVEVSDPPHFFKYTPIEGWLPSLLCGDSLLFSSRLSFNDPFDSRPGFKVTLETKEGRNFMQGKLRSRTQLKPAQRIMHLRRLEQLQKRQTTDSNEGVNTLLDSAGILSLATSWENPLLWAHYAKHHKGICIGFHSNIGIFRLAHKINYEEKMPILLRPQDTPQQMLDKTFLTKSKCWEYENEWRIIKPKQTQYEKDVTFSKNLELKRLMLDCNGPGIYKFAKDSIESVTIGMRTPKQDEDFVKETMKNLGNHVPLYKVEALGMTYELRRKLIGVY